MKTNQAVASRLRASCPLSLPLIDCKHAKDLICTLTHGKLIACAMAAHDDAIYATFSLSSLSPSALFCCVSQGS